MRAISAVFLLLAVGFAGRAIGAPVDYQDTDRNHRDSPGDLLRLGNNLLLLEFHFTDLGGNQSRVAPRNNGWFLYSVDYRGEKFFLHPDPARYPEEYPFMLANDAVGMSAFLERAAYQDQPFLWLWNYSKEPRQSGLAAQLSFSPYLQSWQYYTLYERHEDRRGELAFLSDKGGATQELAYILDGPNLTIRYTAKNLRPRPATFTGIIALPMNRIITTVYTPPDLPVTRNLAPAASSDNFTCALTATDGLPGSGMLFWARGRFSLLHMDGLFSWHRLDLKAGQAASRSMTVSFLDQNLDDYYRDYLARNHISFDPVDWDAAEKNLVALVPRVIMPEGYIYHTYDYNPPGTNRDWHNEMTGRALIVQHLSTGGREWLDWTTRANNYYLDRMYFDNPRHVCYGLFRDQAFADKLTDCYPWSQPYNVESLVAEYAVSRDERLREVLLTHFRQMYEGPIWNAAGRRWYWRMHDSRHADDFNMFDSLEFGADVMIAAFEFTGDRKYLDRAVEVVKGYRRALDNFGLLLEDRAGEPSVNTSVFAAKVLFKLYEYTGDGYWKDRAVRILNATLYSRVFMEPYGPEDAWLKGALSRKDGDWRNQWGEPTTGTDSSVPSQTSFIPWVNEALVAAYNHTGNRMYLDYLGQLMHHQLEANRRLSELTSGRAFACGHYNLYSEKFKEDNDGLTVVSNLFLFPYVQAWARGVRAPHSSVVLLPGPGKSVRAFHLSGRAEQVTLVLTGVKVTRVVETEIDGRERGPVEYAAQAGAVGFTAGPWSMYRADLE